MALLPGEPGTEHPSNATGKPYQMNGKWWQPFQISSDLWDVREISDPSLPGTNLPASNVAGAAGTNLGSGTQPSWNIRNVPLSPNATPPPAGAFLPAGYTTWEEFINRPRYTSWEQLKPTLPQPWASFPKYNIPPQTTTEAKPPAELSAPKLSPQTRQLAEAYNPLPTAPTFRRQRFVSPFSLPKYYGTGTRSNYRNRIQ